MKLNLLLMSFMSLFLLSYPPQTIAQTGESGESTSEEEAIVEPLGQSPEGSPLFQITSSGINVEEAILAGQRKAVECCLFPSEALTSVKSIFPADKRNKHRAYFDQFLEGEGDYLHFVRLTSDGFPMEHNRQKTKNGYRVIIKVEVLYANLLREMKNEGIVD